MLAELEGHADGENPSYPTLTSITMMSGVVYRDALHDEMRGEMTSPASAELFDRAVEAAKRTITYFPDEAQAYVNLANLLRFRQLELSTLEWVRLDPEKRLANVMDFESIPPMTPEVIDLHREALRLDPKNGFIVFMAVQAYIDDQNFEYAEELIQRLISEHDYGGVDGQCLLARIRVKQGRFEEASEILNDVIRKGCSDVHVYRQLIEALWLAGDIGRMKEQIDSALKRFSPPFKLLMETIRYELAQGREDEANVLLKEHCQEVYERLLMKPRPISS